MCTRVWLFVRRVCTSASVRHICNSQPPLSRSLPTYTASFFFFCMCFPLCIVLACSYCICLDWLVVWLCLLASGWGVGLQRRGGETETETGTGSLPKYSITVYTPPHTHTKTNKTFPLLLISLVSWIAHLSPLQVLPATRPSLLLFFYFSSSFFSFHTPVFSPSVSPHFSPLRFSREEECQWLGGVRKNGRAVPINRSVLSTPALVEWNQIKKKKEKRITECVHVCMCVCVCVCMCVQEGVGGGGQLGV